MCDTNQKLGEPRVNLQDRLKTNQVLQERLKGTDEAIAMLNGVAVGLIISADCQVLVC